jgi:PAS domain S-box-containing protein
VILLSARAGEESRVEGLESGADDYLVKPFSARELQARVTARLEIARIRRESDAVRLSTEEQLRASEEKLQAALDGGGLGAWSWDPAADVATVDARARALFSLDGASRKVSAREVFDRIHPDDQAATHAALLRALDPGEEYYAEFRVVSPGEPVRWVAGAGRARLDAEGRVTQIHGVNYDITGRKQAEEALREADRRKDEFLAMLAHELRNPLAPIRNAAQVLKLVGGGDARQQWAREVIERQTQHLTRLVDDLLDVSRITRGKVTLAREPLDLASIVQRAVEASRPLIDSRRHQLTVAVSPEPVRLEGDLTRLVQVVGNLLNNAAKYTDEGGEIRVEAGREEEEAVIRVRDNGMGVPADLLPHVFDLFTQADRSLDRSQGGLGIGLTLVRQLVELHGGRVEARSGGPGQGSEFVVRLPATASADAVEAASTAGGRALPSASTLRILLVEDNPDSAEMMSFLLKLSGHEVRTARDGPEALEVARAFHPEAVLCDIGLPGMNGYEVAERLREQPALRHTPLIALTGYGQEEARRRSREAGFDYHLVKPVEPEALGALLDSLRADRTAGKVSA